MTVTVQEFDEICRICMERGRLLPIFGTQIRAGDIGKVINDHSGAISKYSDVEVGKDDGLPQKMCYGCLFLLNSAIQFKRTCERSNEVLNYLLKNDESRDCRSDGDEAETAVNCSTFELLDDNAIGRLSNLVDGDDGSLLLIVPPEDKEADAYNDDAYRGDDSNDDGRPISSDGGDVIAPSKEIPSKTKGSGAPSSAGIVKRTYLQVLAEKNRKKSRRKRVKNDKRAEFEELSKTVNDVAARRDVVDASVPAALHELVLRNHRVRDAATGRWFVERSRATFTPVVVPGKGKRYQCRVCQIVVNGSSTHNHSQLHIGYKIMCELCGKGFVSNFALKQHQMTRHGREKHLTCQFCSYKTGYKFELNVHERLHTGERPFVCDHCGKSFYRKLCLMKHLSLHTNIRPHTCQVCSKSFYLLDELKRHINANHDRRYMYKCDRCETLYAKAGTVRKHLVAQHSVPREQQGKIPRVFFH